MKYLITVVLLFLSSSKLYLQEKSYKVELTSINVLLNNKDEKRKEYLLGRPIEALVDSKNNVFVIDYHGTEIRKFSKDGKYISTLGRVGDGPGEFRGISCFDLSNDKLLIYGSPMKFTEYSNGGDYIKSMDAAKCYPLHQIWYYGPDKFLLKKFDDTENIENIFHIFDNKLEKEITSFGHPSVLFDVKSPSYLNERSQINVLKAPNGDLFVGKKIYDGKLYAFRAKENWKSYVYKRKNYDYKQNRYLIPVTKDDFDNNFFMVSFQDNKTKKQAGIALRTISAGLLLYKNKYILNFVLQDLSKNANDLICEFGVEIFNTSGEFLGYSKIEDENVKYTGFKTNVFCIDGEDCLYMLSAVNLGGNTWVNTIKKCKIKLLIN